MLNIIRTLANKRFAILPQRLVHGAAVMRNYHFLLDSQYWSAEQLAAFQLRALQRLITHAYHQSTFYRVRFEQIGLEPGDVKSFQDMRQIPYLTKQDLRDNFETIKVRDFARHHPILTRTGGTTGAPVTLYRSRNTAEMRQAIEWRNYHWAGQDYRQRKMSLFPGTSRDIGKEPYFEDPRHRMLVVKTFQLDPERLRLFHHLYHRYRPSFLMGIVEFYRVLGRFLEREGLDDIKSPALFVQGEAVTPIDRERFCRWFGARVYDYYGMRENAVSASECTEGTMHINQEFVFQEFENDRRPALPGEPAEIIGTSLHNFAMPLIRCRTGDIGQLESAPCACSRTHQAMRITGGRTRDFISTPTRLIYICHHMSYLLDLSDGVEALQFYQPDRGTVVIRVVRNSNYTREDTDKLTNALARLTGGELRIEIEFVEDIPRTRVGKYRFVVSDIDPTL